MFSDQVVRRLSVGFVLFSMLALVSVSLMAFASPQAVMDLVGVRLPNTDAFSSIRGVYGGVGMAIVISLGYLVRQQVRLALGFLVLLWGGYALSRVITIWVEGPLGAFGTQWIITESVLLVLAAGLLWLNRKPLIF